MMTMRLVCTCGRNMLDVKLMPSGNHITVKPRVRDGWRLHGETHNVTCLCGENWMIPERQLLNWARQRMLADTTENGPVRRAGVLRVRLADLR